MTELKVSNNYWYHCAVPNLIQESLYTLHCVVSLEEKSTLKHAFSFALRNAYRSFRLGVISYICFLFSFSYIPGILKTVLWGDLKIVNNKCRWMHAHKNCINKINKWVY